MASAAEQLARNLSFSTFSKAKALQKRILFTLGVLLVYRLGTYIPVPGIDPDAYASMFERTSTGIFGMFDMFAGGAVSRMAIFALNLIPYITASIVIQVTPTVGKAPVRLNSRVWAMVLGRLATIPAKMINEMPLPTPREVICSPSHIKNMVPPTRVMTVETRKNHPGSSTTPWLDSSPTAMP